MHAELLELAKKVGADAAALLMDRPPAFEIEEKSTAIDIVTQMDKKAETFIVQSILAARPDDGMIGEEGADIEEMERKITAAKMPKEAKVKAEAELKKLKLMSPMSAEATVVRNYIDVLVGLPWSKKTKIKHDLGNAENVLNEDHYGLDKVKDRILEYLAVQQRVDKDKAPSCVWWGLLAWVKPRWVNRLPKPQGASMCAWLWVACATRPRFVAIAVPTLVPCPAKCCRA